MAPPMEQTTLAPWSQTWTNSSAGGSHDRAPGLETASGPGRGQVPDGDDTLAVARYWPAAGPVASPTSTSTSPRSPANRPALPAPLPRVLLHVHIKAHVDIKKLGDPPRRRTVAFTRGASTNKNTAATQDNPPKPNHHTLVGPRWYTPPSMTTPASPSAQTHDDQSNDPRWGATPSHRLARRTRVHIERVLGDNGSADRRLCGAIPVPIAQSPTNEPTGRRPNAKIERLHPTPANCCGSNAPPAPNARHRRRYQHGFTRNHQRPPHLARQGHTHQRPNQPGRPVHAVSAPSRSSGQAALLAAMNPALAITPMSAWSVNKPSMPVARNRVCSSMARPIAVTSVPMR